MKPVKFTKRYVSIADAYKDNPLDDSHCFTIAQVDKLLEDNEFDKRFTQFDIANFRNYLVNRMQNRLLYKSGQRGLAQFRSEQERFIFCRDYGYQMFLTVMEWQHENEKITDKELHREDALKGSEVLFGYLRDSGEPLSGLKFIFSVESVEAIFFIGESKVSIEYFYDTPNSVMLDVFRFNNMYVDEFSDRETAWKFIRNAAEALNQIKPTDVDDLKSEIDDGGKKPMKPSTDKNLATACILAMLLGLLIAYLLY